MRHTISPLRQKQLKSLEVGATAVGALALGLYEIKTGKLSFLASEFIPLAEEAGTSVWASALKAANCAPKTNYFELKNGTELTFDRNISLFSTPTDMVSIVDAPVSCFCLLCRILF